MSEPKRRWKIALTFRLTGDRHEHREHTVTDFKLDDILGEVEDWTAAYIVITQAANTPPPEPAGVS